MSYMSYVCLCAYSGVQHILRCDFVLFFFVLCTLCCQCLFFCFLCLLAYGGVWHVLPTWVTWWVYYKRQELLTLREHLGSFTVFYWVRVPHLLSFLLFVFVLCPVHLMLPVSLDCPFLICRSVFSDVYCLSFSDFLVQFSKRFDGVAFYIHFLSLFITELNNTRSLIHTSWQKHSRLYILSKCINWYILTHTLTLSCNA